MRQGDSPSFPLDVEHTNPRAGHTTIAADGATLQISRLAAELSHDLRVPLSAIIAGLELLEAELGQNPAPAVEALLDRTAQAADRMMRMLDQNLAIDPVMVGRMRVNVDLGQVASQLAQTLPSSWSWQVPRSKWGGCRSYARTRTRCTPSSRTFSPTL